MDADARGVVIRVLNFGQTAVPMKTSMNFREELVWAFMSSGIEMISL